MLSKQVEEISQRILNQLPSGAAPKVGIVLGSGWANYVDSFQDVVQMSYPQLGFPITGVAGHKNALVYGKKFSVDTLIMQGRIHHYEGYDLKTVVLPIRALIKSGCQLIILTNAAGGIQKGLVPGQLVIIRDHINLMGGSPLYGENDPKLGVRFPDMTYTYDVKLQQLASQIGQRENLGLKSGVYAAVAGPQYETPAEIRMLSQMGADLVGMSTVPEAIAARHMGAKVLGISCVSNIAAGLSGQVLSHEEVTETAALAQHSYISLLDGILQSLGKEISL